MLRIEWISGGDNALPALTALEGETQVGAAKLLPYHEKNSLLISDLAVSPACRGRGYGRRILAALSERAKDLGAEILYAMAPLTAAGFFEACGFHKASVVQTQNGEPSILLAKTFALENDAFLSFGNRYEAVICRGDFTLPAEPEAVTADILPCGFAEIYVNGKKCSEDLYAPAWTNYCQQDFSEIEFPTEDAFCFRSYYLRLDLTAFAKQGENAFAVHIANGWYAQWESRNGGNKPYGEKKLCYRITARLKTGETLCFSSSDGGCRFRGSYITKSSMYFGEEQDLRLAADDLFTEDTDTASYCPALPAARPDTLILPQTCPPDRVLRTVTNPEVIYAFGDRKIYDLGENLAGFALLHFGKGAGMNERITVRYAENLNGDGSLNFHSTGGTNRLSVDEFRNCGGRRGEETPLYPHFLWHTGRYVEVTGYHRFEAFCVTATDVPVTSGFRSSDPVLNWLYDAFIRTQIDNMHCSIPSDCPHRERLGYTGDGQLTASAVMTMFDARGFYEKWLRDIADCQDIFGGHVQYTAPFYGGGGPGGWGCAIAAIPYELRRFYGDDTAAKTYYPHIRKYLDYMEAKCDGHIVTRAEDGGWCLGDWCTPHNNKIGIPIPPPFVNTYFYIRSLRQAMELAPIAGHEAELPELKAREAAAVRAFTERFFDPETGSFCEGVNGADAFALDLGLGDGRTLQNLVNRYRALRTFDTGIFGTKLVLSVLFRNGCGDDAVKLMGNRGEVSFFHMMESGATTLWEEWFNEHSSCHPMFGASAELLFSEILGIRQKEGSTGFAQIEIKPANAPSLDWAEGFVKLGGKTVTVRVEHGKCVNAQIT